METPWVAPEYRRQGVATTLISSLGPSSQLDVLAENEPARALYQKLNWKVHGPALGNWGSNPRSLRMTKKASITSALEGLIATPARSRITGGLALGALGAGVGAGVDRKHRVRGAVAGGVLGGALGATLTPGALARTKWAKPSDMVSYQQSLTNEGDGFTTRAGRALKRTRTHDLGDDDITEALGEISRIARRGPSRDIFSSKNLNRQGQPVVKVEHRHGRGMLASVYPEELDVAGWHAPVAVARLHTRFGQTPAEFAQEALDYARAHTKDLTYAHKTASPENPQRPVVLHTRLR